MLCRRIDLLTITDCRGICLEKRESRIPLLFPQEKEEDEERGYGGRKGTLVSKRETHMSPTLVLRGESRASRRRVGPFQVSMDRGGRISSWTRRSFSSVPACIRGRHPRPS